MVSLASIDKIINQLNVSASRKVRDSGTEGRQFFFIESNYTFMYFPFCYVLSTPSVDQNSLIKFSDSDGRSLQTVLISS